MPDSAGMERIVTNVAVPMETVPTQTVVECVASACIMAASPKRFSAPQMPLQSRGACLQQRAPSTNGLPKPVRI